jgi:hypothetical protein
MSLRYSYRESSQGLILLSNLADSFLWDVKQGQLVDGHANVGQPLLAGVEKKQESALE